MEIIETRLAHFTSAWQTHDIDAVLDLFADDVEYRETPFQKCSKGVYLITLDAHDRCTYFFHCGEIAD